MMSEEAGIRAAGISGAQQALVWHRICSRCARLASCPWAGAPVRCHVSEGQEAGRARYLERLVFGQPGFQDRSGPRLVHRPRAADRRACPPLASPQKIYY